ncbi:MAG: glycoside hydrolase domain-containing protein [Planctomycetota bacterium]
MRSFLSAGAFVVLSALPLRAAERDLVVWVERIRSIDPKLRIVSPCYRDAADGRSAYDGLDGLAATWCAVSAYFQPPRMDERRKEGEEVWWYVCCGPGSPYANLHLTMDAVEHRVLPWQMYRSRVEGFLCWSTTYWNPAAIENPWTSMVTVPEINRELAGRVARGLTHFAKDPAELERVREEIAARIVGARSK